MTPEELARFEAKLTPEPTTGCWLWGGAAISAGYGYFCVGGKNARAHRVAFEHFRGTIPGGLFVCHSCDNRACVNPEHLWLGTALDNNRDCKAKGRHARNEARTGFLRPAGPNHPSRSITQEMVAWARASLAPPTAPRRKGVRRAGTLAWCAEQLGVSTSGLRVALRVLS